MIFLYMIICIGFFFESCYRSEKARRNLLLAYIILIVLVRNIYYLMLILQDKVPNAICEDVLEEANDECLSKWTTLLLVDSVGGWIAEAYCAFVLLRHSKQPIDDNDDDYD